MKIPIIFLGTGAVVPTAERNHPSILLKYKNENILFDCGEGTQRQFRKAKLNPCKLTKILITHWHGDHVLGLPGLFQTLALNGYKKTLHIHGPKGTKKFIKEIFKVFIPRKQIKTKVHEVKGKFFETPDFRLIALPLKHGHVPCNGYAFEEKSRLRIDKKKLKKLKISPKDRAKIARLSAGKNIKVKGKTIKAKSLTYKQTGKKICIIFDTRICQNVKKLVANCNLAIMESTYSKSEANLAKERGHMTSEQAAQTAKQSKAKRLILTHLSQRYENKENKIKRQARKIFPNTIVARDLMRTEI